MKKIITVIAAVLLVAVAAGIILYSKAGAENYEELEFGRTGYYTTGRDLLSENLQKNYDKLLQNIYKLQPNFKADDLSSKEVKQLIYFLRDDNPQIFWLNNNYGYEHNLVTREITTVDFQYFYTDTETGEDVPYTKELVEQMNAQILASAQVILDGVAPEASTYSKVKYLHDYLAKSVVYDETATFQHNIYGALVEKRAVCDGLSYAMMYLLSNLGIESRLVYGVSNEGVSHAWNIIDIDGEYYHVDVTWDMPPEGSNTVLYSNLNVTDDKIAGDREQFSPFEGESVGKYFYYIPVPHCTATQYNYYRYNDLYIESYEDSDLSHIFDVLEQAVDTGKTEVQFQFADTDDFDAFVEDVTSGTNRKFYRFPYTNSQRKTSLSKVEKENIVLISFEYLE